MFHVRLQEVLHNKSDMVKNFSKPRDLPVNKAGVPCMHRLRQGTSCGETQQQDEGLVTGQKRKECKLLIQSRA